MTVSMSHYGLSPPLRVPSTWGHKTQVSPGPQSICHHQMLPFGADWGISWPASTITLNSSEHHISDFFFLLKKRSISLYKWGRGSHETELKTKEKGGKEALME